MNHGLLHVSTALDGVCERTQILDLNTYRMSETVEEA